VLSEANRLRRSADFVRVTRTGRRCARSSLVVHLELGREVSPPLVGFVVSKAVGGAVVRNAVTRRLRALVRDRLDRFPAGSTVVLRALPSAAAVSSARLGAELDSCMARLLEAGTRPASP
jgi:ribonuclease P protein component